MTVNHDPPAATPRPPYVPPDMSDAAAELLITLVTYAGTRVNNLAECQFSISVADCEPESLMQALHELSGTPLRRELSPELGFVVTQIFATFQMRHDARIDFSFTPGFAALIASLHIPFQRQH